MKLIEAYYWLMNIPYYRIMIVKDMEVLKTIVQPILIKDKKIKGTNEAYVDVKGKRSWFKMPEACFRDGKKFIGIVDIDNAIQMIEETKVKVEGNGIIIKEQTITRLKNSVIELKADTGKMKRFVTAFPSTMLYEVLEGSFVTMALSNPKEKTDWSMVVMVIGIGLIALIGYYLMFTKH